MNWILLPAALASCANAEMRQQPASPSPLSPKEAHQPPLVVHNPDGSFTIQRDADKQKGLVIKPQVVTPITRPEKR